MLDPETLVDEPKLKTGKGRWIIGSWDPFTRLDPLVSSLFHCEHILWVVFDPWQDTKHIQTWKVRGLWETSSLMINIISTPLSPCPSPQCTVSSVSMTVSVLPFPPVGPDLGQWRGGATWGDTRPSPESTSRGSFASHVSGPLLHLHVFLSCGTLHNTYTYCDLRPGCSVFELLVVVFQGWNSPTNFWHANRIWIWNFDVNDHQWEWLRSLCQSWLRRYTLIKFINDPHSTPGQRRWVSHQLDGSRHTPVGTVTRTRETDSEVTGRWTIEDSKSEWDPQKRCTCLHYLCYLFHLYISLIYNISFWFYIYRSRFV